MRILILLLALLLAGCAPAQPVPVDGFCRRDVPTTYPGDIRAVRPPQAQAWLDAHNRWATTYCRRDH